MLFWRPDYHHGNEILAMKAAGVKIRYYPIQKDLDVNLGELARLCELEPKPRALYLTHFIGWPQPLDAIQRLCRDKRLMLIEDCALSFMSEYQQKPLGYIRIVFDLLFVQVASSAQWRSAGKQQMVHLQNRMTCSHVPRCRSRPGVPTLYFIGCVPDRILVDERCLG